MSVVEVSANISGRTLTLQTGKMAKQTDASVLCRYGDTMVLVTVVSSKKLKENQEFFPLTVDYQEKYYSAGRIPGGFFKREARPSDRATLSARIIDRPIRPLFPEDYMFETNVVATVLSNDGVNEPDLLASIGASCALHISDIPWAGPIACGRVGHINGEMVMNFSPADQANSSLDLLVSGGRSGIVMVEGSSKEVNEKLLNDAIYFAHEQMQAIFDMQDELKAKVGREKRAYEHPKRDEALKTDMRKALLSGFKSAFAIREKLARYEALDKVKSNAKEKFLIEEPKTDADETRNKMVPIYIEELKATYAREHTLNTKTRIDGRPYNEIRSISCETGLLPRVHGSALFTRGETQVLSTVTLGTADDEQKIDSITGIYQKAFMLHYNFPPFSVGEARPLRGPGRREIGHGFLAERALTFIMPPKEQFPYTVRIVSEVLESNGSSSMATVCSGSMALMDAGVPVAKPVAGVAMGLIKEGERVAILSDILGDEDHLGDMDFKVCGTADGVTAFQMDLKIGGVSRVIMEQALEQAREGRLHILGEMSKVIEKARESVSAYAPRIYTIKVKPDKVREVIGSGGKVIRGIIEQTGVKIDIEDDGSVHIASVDDASAQKAIEIIKRIVEEPEAGRIYEGKVTRIADFGAFIEIIPGTEGLCHISELDLQRVRRVEDVVQIGDTVRVKCLEVESSGKMRLSRKALLREGAAMAPAVPTPTQADPNAAASTEIKPTAPGDYFADSETEMDNSSLVRDPEDRPLREARRISNRDRQDGGPRRDSRRPSSGPRSDGPREGAGRGGYREGGGGHRDAGPRSEGRGGPGRAAWGERGPAPYRGTGTGRGGEDRFGTEPNFNDRNYQDRGGSDRGNRGPRRDRPDRGDYQPRDYRPREGQTRDRNANDRFGRGGADRGGADRGGADRGAADRGGADRGAADRGGADRGAADRGGADRGGADRGGADRGGADRGGADRGAADRGGADRGAADRGGRSPQWNEDDAPYAPPRYQRDDEE